MATVPVDGGFLCDKVTVLRKMIKHLHPVFCAPVGSTGGYTVLQLCILVTAVHFVGFARTFFCQNMENRLLEQRMNIKFLLTLKKQF